jgi:hypothetical protein
VQVAVVLPAGTPLLGADGVPAEPLHRAALAAASPGLVVAAGPAGARVPGLLADRVPVDGRPAAYPCRGFVCDLPVTDPDQLRTAIAGA